jgi:hypothetical protein
MSCHHEEVSPVIRDHESPLEMTERMLRVMQRELDIAKRLLRYVLRKQGTQLSGNTARELNNIAKAISVPVKDLQEFARPFIQELVDECFGTKTEEAIRHAFSK